MHVCVPVHEISHSGGRSHAVVKHLGFNKIMHEICVRYPDGYFNPNSWIYDSTLRRKKWIKQIYLGWKLSGT